MYGMSRRQCLVALLGGPLAAVVSPASGAETARAPVRDPEHVFGIRPRSWLELKRRNVAMQKYDYSCGAAALSTILQYYWEDPVTEKQILEVLFKMLTTEELQDRTKNGMAITDLRLIAVKMGYLASIGTLSFDKLTEAKVPVIVPIRINDYDHFVVCRGVAGGHVYLADPLRGNVRATIAEFCDQWNKNAIFVVMKKGASPLASSRLSIRPDEILMGETNKQWVRQELSRPSPLPPSTPGFIH